MKFTPQTLLVALFLLLLLSSVFLVSQMQKYAGTKNNECDCHEVTNTLINNPSTTLEEATVPLPPVVSTPNITIPAPDVQTSYNETRSPIYPLLIKRKIFPQRHPKLCVAFLSCNRYALLRNNMLLLLQHLENVESDIPYELVIVDNGCAPSINVHEKILSRFEVDKYTVHAANLGIAVGINAVFFGLCTAPFILSVEDDWEFVSTPSETIFSRAMHVLDYHTSQNLEPKLVGIYMGHEAYYEKEQDHFTDKSIVYRVIESGSGWCFANGGTFLQRSALWEVGPQEPRQGMEAEMLYKDRVYTKGYRMGSLMRDDRVFMRGFEHRGSHIEEPLLLN